MAKEKDKVDVKALEEAIKIKSKIIKGNKIVKK